MVKVFRVQSLSILVRPKMLYTVSNFQLANSHNLQDMNYILVLSFGQVTLDGWTDGK